MKIKTIEYQHRRDFTAIFVCEHCNAEVRLTDCYDDDNYHVNIIPKMICAKCGKGVSDDYRPLTTKYKSWEVI